MKSDEMEAFTGVLATIFQSCHRPLPSAGELRIWWAKLESFSLIEVTLALYQHVGVSSKAPTMADILKILPSKGAVHPEPDEAWAIAVRAADERETVVWTDQILEGWEIAKSVFDLGDEVGARMAFKAAYARIVTQANAMGVLAQWRISSGADPERRQRVAERAVRDGRLQFGQVRDILPPPGTACVGWPLLSCSGEHPGLSAVGAEHLKRLTAFLRGTTSAMARVDAENARGAKVQREQLAAKKRATVEQVRKYKQVRSAAGRE